MKPFLIKFLIFFSLFYISAAYFHFYVTNQISGDIGELGMIPFGHEREGLDVASYQRSGIADAHVTEVVQPDVLASYSVVTIGDSFSHKEKLGYQWKLSSLMCDSIANFLLGKHDPFKCAIQLINSDLIRPGQTLIIETAERNLVERLLVLDTTLTWSPAPTTSSGNAPAFIDNYLSWIRLSLGYDNPIHRFKLSHECFLNPKYPKTLYVYSGEFDGDFLFKNFSEQTYSSAAIRLRQFIEFGQSRGIRIFVLIATDKYDAYEPFISREHDINPTLVYFQGIDGVYDPKRDIQEAIKNGTMEFYKQNDTHWSVIGADLVAEKFAAYIRNQTSSL